MFRSDKIIRQSSLRISDYSRPVPGYTVPSFWFAVKLQFSYSNEVRKRVPASSNTVNIVTTRQLIVVNRMQILGDREISWVIDHRRVNDISQLPCV